MKTKVTLADVKDFAYKQMDAMWHDGSGLVTKDMVRFTFNRYCVVNPWMDEKTKRRVNPYSYYGRKRTRRFIKQAIKVIQRDRELEEKHRR